MMNANEITHTVITTSGQAVRITVNFAKLAERKRLKLIRNKDHRVVYAGGALTLRIIENARP